MPYEVEYRKRAFTVQRISRLLPKPHIHPHLELIYLKSGSSVATLDNMEYRFEAGECFLAFPNQIHFYHDEEPVEGIMIIFSPDIFREFKEIFNMKTPVFPIVNCRNKQNDVAIQMEKIYEKAQCESNYQEVIVKGLFLAVLGELFSVMEFVNNPTEQDDIKRILAFCLEHYTESVSLELMAKELYLNKYYVSRVFKERMNVGYKEFMNKLRIEHACRMLDTGARATEVAYASGFSSVRTFNRVFLKYMGVNPREYKKDTVCDTVSLKYNV